MRAVRSRSKAGAALLDTDVAHPAHDPVTRLLIEAFYAEADALDCDDLAHRAFRLARIRLQCLADPSTSAENPASAQAGERSKRAATAVFLLRALLGFTGNDDRLGYDLIDMGLRYFAGPMSHQSPCRARPDEVLREMAT